MNQKFKLNQSIAGKSFLVTGGAGFIGSNLSEFLLNSGAKKVVVLDDLSTGYLENIEDLRSDSRFEFIQGDITSFDDCLKATQNIDIVFHEAALGSVPRSIANPMATNTVNAGGFVNILFASQKNSVKRVVYASSSSVYGDDKTMPKKEEITGNLLSPYAVSKKTNELYASVFYNTYGLEVIGLRYFNVFGPQQNINGPYAAVIPIFITHLLSGKAPTIFGNGQTTRDFTHVNNVIQANLLAALTEKKEAVGQVFNVAYGDTTSLNKLYGFIAEELGSSLKPVYAEERKGDIKDSFADISKAKNILGFSPDTDLKEGIIQTIAWYRKKLK